MQPTGIPVDLDQLITQSLFCDLDPKCVGSIARGGWIVQKRRASRILGRGDRLDGLYMQYQPFMLEPEGIEAMRALSEQYAVGM